MIKYIVKGSKYCLLIAALCLLNSCLNELDRMPTNGITADKLYSTVDGYKKSMATVYAGLATEYFLREYWNMQEFPTDEAITTWDDPQGTLSFNTMTWNADNGAVYSFYSRVMYNITLSNNFLIESSDARLNTRGFSDADKKIVQGYVAEVRFLRAYYYWVMLDLFGNPPFATEQTLLESKAPEQIKQADLFAFIEAELKEVEALEVLPSRNEYGRASRGAVRALLARLYLNAGVYTGTQRYTDALTYSQKVIDDNYALENYYSWLMLGDNHLNTNEFIFTINYDNAKFETWGGTGYLALGPANVPKEINGMSDSWTTMRMRPSFVALFPSADTLQDKRGIFWTDTQTLEIDNITDFNQGYTSYKFRNVTRSGEAIPQNNAFNNLSDIDFPIFRLAEMYLIYAESHLKGGGGSATTALSYINKLRGRAYAADEQSTEGNVTVEDLTQQFILDERGRELYWEGHRRTDLLRYDLFTTANYLWSWKGGTQAGAAVHDRYKLYPIPTTDLLANKNLEPNPGY